MGSRCQSLLVRSALTLSVALWGCSDGLTGPTTAPDALAAKGGVPGPPDGGGGGGGGGNGGGGNDDGGGEPVEPGAGFRDDFGSFNEALWARTDHDLGLGTFEPRNVDVKQGELRLEQPRRKTDGGEVTTWQTTGYGTFEASIKASPQPGVISTMFLFGARPPGPLSLQAEQAIDEIDIEIFQDTRPGASGGWVMEAVAWHSANTIDVPPVKATVPLDFDPSADFHTYAIAYGPGEATFFVDGTEVAHLSETIPGSNTVPSNPAMYLMANAWWPTWLGGTSTKQLHWAAYDWISFTPSG